MTTGERQAERIRYLYLQALLRQDLSFYDQEVTTGAVVEGIAADTFHIKQATGEKVNILKWNYNVQEAHVKIFFSV